MTARQYAKLVGFEVVGKLTRKTAEQWAWGPDGEYLKKFVYWIDEAGNEFHGDSKSWCITTADGGVI